MDDVCGDTENICDTVNICEITNSDYENLRETACMLIEKYISLNIIQYMQPNFHTTVCKDVAGLLKYTINGAFDEDNLFSAIIERCVEDGFILFYKHILPHRSSGPTFIRTKPNMHKLRTKINYLQTVPQPEQRTPEWYQFRYTHLTASNIWKTFISESTRNQLIYEKCQPLNADKHNYVNLESPMHWGQKYESLSVKLYESIYKTKVSDFGCIPHKTIGFLAASPDGINTLESSWRYGRMLEVKNIVNREITGIPKLEYWVQMQLQMEVCDLNECDFLETRFTEYPDEEAYNTCPSLQKGMMMLFMNKHGQPLYELVGGNPANNAEEIMEKNKELTWVKNIYWKLDQISCVLVLRNKSWFAAALPQLVELWKTIESEKKTGFKHRAPKKNNSSNSNNSSGINIGSTSIKVKKMDADPTSIEMPAKCFITIAT